MAGATKVSDQGLAEIAGHEGIILSPYYDSVGVLTVFVGHTQPAGAPDPATLPLGREQPMDVALSVFQRDMAKYTADVLRAVTVPLAQHELDALVSFHFNTGAIATCTLVKKLNAGDRAAAILQFDRWHKPPEITGRRDKEKKLFATGVYSNGGKALVSPADARGRVQYSRGRSIDVLTLLRSGAVVAAPNPPPDVEPAPVNPANPDEPQGFWAWLFGLLFGRK